MTEHPASHNAAPAASKTTIRAALVSALLPGLGHLMSGHRRLGAVLGGGFALGAAIAFFHLFSGLAIFESALGSFAFGALLRGLTLLWAFGSLDVYLRGLGLGDASRRANTVANFLLPGAGYLLARSWVRGGSSVLVMIVVVYVGRLPNRYLDLIFIGFQLIAAFGVYHQQAMAQLERERDQPRLVPHVDHLPVVQIQLLVQLMAAAVLFGWIVLLRMNDVSLLRISDDDVVVRRRVGGIAVKLDSHQLSFMATGSGWKHQRGVDGGAFFRARHQLGASLVLGVQPVLPFVRSERYLLAVQRQLEGSGYHLERQQSLQVGGLSATQLRLSRETSGMTLDRWAIVVPRGDLAYVLILSCGREICQRLLPAFEKSRDSLRIGGGAGPRAGL
ncbi:MAG: hypothetical protein CSA24_01990 [Deltaproteobacteria bacterium]|nr:MAG: hypothetical protein CSB49_08745 [Pseudomonadota bacterium]PIE65770.1 MAG: hypothetical protein CSA24_01990 [Deltaproteobacteria bacterium]